MDNSKNDNAIGDETKIRKSAPGDGIRSLKSSYAFRLINYELYVKPNIVIMTIGLVAISGVFGYIGYMRYKYESLGYYTAVKSDGTEVFEKKKSRWAQ